MTNFNYPSMHEGENHSQEQSTLNTYCIEAVIEAILFASGEKVSSCKIAEVLEVAEEQVCEILNEMMNYYKNSDRGIEIRKMGNFYKLVTKCEYYDVIKKIFEPKQKAGLSQAAFETLSIIAYHQPITKFKIEQIRGVNSDSAIAKLIEKSLIKEAGKLETPGKPIIYETTEKFLFTFNLNSIEELPAIDCLINTESADVKILQ